MAKPVGSALSLAVSRLLCAAVILGPLATGNANSGSSRLGQRAQAIELRAKRLKTVLGVGKAVHDLEMGEDALVVWVSTGSR